MGKDKIQKKKRHSSDDESSDNDIKNKSNKKKGNQRKRNSQSSSSQLSSSSEINSNGSYKPKQNKQNKNKKNDKNDDDSSNKSYLSSNDDKEKQSSEEEDNFKIEETVLITEMEEKKEVKKEKTEIKYETIDGIDENLLNMSYKYVINQFMCSFTKEHGEDYYYISHLLSNTESYLIKVKSELVQKFKEILNSVKMTKVSKEYSKNYSSIEYLNEI